MDEGGGQGNYNWRDNYLRGLLQRPRTKRSFHTMAEGHRDHTSVDLHGNSNGNNDASGSEINTVDRERTPYEVHPYARQHRRDHAHARTHTQPHTHITNRASSPLFVPMVSPIVGPRDLSVPHQTAQQSHSTDNSQRPRLALPPLSSRGEFEAAHARFPGDGFDFRRPIMGNGEARTRQSHIVDLTGDEDPNTEAGERDTAAVATGATSSAWRSSRRQGLPNFGRDIIAVEAEPERLVETIGRQGAERREGNPQGDGDDVVITESRSLRTSRLQSRRPTPAYPRSITPHLANLDGPIDLTDDQDDVIITDTRRLNVADNPNHDVQRPVDPADYEIRATNGHMEYIANMLREQPRLLHQFEAIGSQLGHMLPILAHEHARRTHGQNEHNHIYARVRDGRSHMPTMMDYGSTGFDLGLADHHRPATPKYSPPPPAPEGFTSNPGEDEVVVCPNCGDELAVGGGKWPGDADDEVKQQIWVVKKCGHAYCGACATRKAPTGMKGSKGKGKEKAVDDGAPPPLKKCVVDGCGQPASKGSLIHVYLSQ